MRFSCHHESGRTHRPPRTCSVERSLPNRAILIISSNEKEISQGGAVASTLKLSRNGAVGFIDWLGLFGDSLISVSPNPAHHHEHADHDRTEQDYTDPGASERTDVIECANGVGDRN